MNKFFKNPEELINTPKILGNATPAEWYEFLKDNGYNPRSLGKSEKWTGVLFENGGGFRINWGGDRILQYHPPGSKYHLDGAAYYKIGSGITRFIWCDIYGNIRETSADRK